MMGLLAYDETEKITSPPVDEGAGHLWNAAVGISPDRQFSRQ